MSGFLMPAGPWLLSMRAWCSRRWRLIISPSVICKGDGCGTERLCQQAVGNQCFADGAHIDGHDFGLASLDSTSLRPSFLDVLGMAQLAAVSMLFRAVYIPIEYLPLSKGQSRKFLCQEAVCVMLLIVMEIAGYRYKGLLGLGFGIVGAYLIETLFVLVYSRCLYRYVLSRKGVIFIAVELVFVAGGLLGGLCGSLQFCIGLFVLFGLLPMSWVPCIC